jgi:hypothetical protein
MKVDFSKPILTLEGKPDEAKTTLGNLACIALTTMLPEDKDMPAEEKVNRFKLAMTVAKGKVQDLSAEDMVLLKKLIGKMFGPLAVGRAYEILDAAAK